MRGLLAGDDAAGEPSGTLTSSDTGIVGVLRNGAFVAAFLGFFFAQTAKVFTHWCALPARAAPSSGGQRKDPC